MSNKNRLIVLLCVILCAHGLYAQPVSYRTMGIDEMFRLADENSKSIQTYQTGTEAAGEAVKAAKAQRLPDINASLSFSYLGDGKLWDRDFSNAKKIPMPHYGNNFSLEAQQVIYAGGAIKSGIELAELARKMTGLDWQKNRQEIRFLLIGHYLDLYKLNNQLLVLKKNLALTDQVLLGLQIAKVEDARKIMNHQLVTTLHLPAGTVIMPDTTLLEEKVKALAEQDWQQAALQNHAGLQQAELGVGISDEKVKLERSERLPKVAVVVSEHLDGPITIEVPVLDNNFNYWYVGIGVRYNLSSLFKNDKKLKQARIEARRAREEYELAHEQVENAVQAGYVNFLTSFTELRTQEKSVELADENYAVTNNRYRNELALLTDMLDASNMKLSADLALVDARINVAYNYYKMKYITHTL